MLVIFAICNAVPNSRVFMLRIVAPIAQPRIETFIASQAL